MQLLAGWGKAQLAGCLVISCKLYILFSSALSEYSWPHPQVELLAAPVFATNTRGNINFHINRPVTNYSEDQEACLL